MATRRCVLFLLGEEEYGIDIFHVEEIVRDLSIQPSISSSTYIAGMVQHRDVVVPVYNLRVRFGLPEKEIHVLLILAIHGVKLALAVDEVSEIVDLEETDLQIPALFHTVDTAYVNKIVSVNGRLVVLLNLESLLSKEEKKKIEDMIQEKKK